MKLANKKKIPTNHKSLEFSNMLITGLEPGLFSRFERQRKSNHNAKITRLSGFELAQNKIYKSVTLLHCQS